MGEVRLNSGLIAKLGEREKLVNILLNASKSINKLPGCDFFHIKVSKEDVNLVFVYEEWINESTYASSRSSLITKNLIESTKPLITGFVRTKRQL